MKLNVALVQDAPIFFDKEKTFQKIESILEEESQKKTEMIVFPESFIPGYPRGLTFGTKIGSRSEEGRNQYLKYHQESVDLESNDRLRLEQMAKDSGLFIVMGITEKTSKNGSLYCSMLYISPEDGLISVHRKIKPTGAERIVWADGNGDDLQVINTRFGKVGGLICWENYMPETRIQLYKQGIQIYIAPTADSRKTWTSTMQHIALEGRCFVLGCNQFVQKSDYPNKIASQLEFENEIHSAGGSVIVAPNGEILKGPQFNESAIIRAELDLDDIIKNKLDFDVNGHYSRTDLFRNKEE